MTIMKPETLTLATLRDLASATPPCITIVIPQNQARDAQIAFKDALTDIRAQLKGTVPKHMATSLLNALEASASETIDSSKEPATFIFLSSPDRNAAFRTPQLLGQSIAAVGDCFRIKTLVEMASNRIVFYVLALSLNNTRIFKCTETSFEPARFPKNAGTDAAGFVPGASQATIRAEPVKDRDHPDEQLGHFFREVDRDVNALLRDGHPPLVVVGVEHEVAMFYRLTTYPACVKPGLHGLPDHFSDQEMYKQALQLVQSVTTGSTEHALENFDKKIGTGHASLDAQAIAEAASSGRVEHLFLLRDDPAVPGSREAGPGLLDTAVMQTLQHGGEVTVLPETSMPAGKGACAVFRDARG